MMHHTFANSSSALLSFRPSLMWPINSDDHTLFDSLGSDHKMSADHRSVGDVKDVRSQR